MTGIIQNKYSGFVATIGLGIHSLYWSNVICCPLNHTDDIRGVIVALQGNTFPPCEGPSTLRVTQQRDTMDADQVTPD